MESKRRRRKEKLRLANDCLQVMSRMFETLLLQSNKARNYKK